jgi:hypothetical protein
MKWNQPCKNVSKNEPDRRHRTFKGPGVGMTWHLKEKDWSSVTWGLMNAWAVGQGQIFQDCEGGHKRQVSFYLVSVCEVRLGANAVCAGLSRSRQEVMCEKHLVFSSMALKWSCIGPAFCQMFCSLTGNFCWKEVSPCSEDTMRELWVEKPWV